MKKKLAFLLIIILAGFLVSCQPEKKTPASPALSIFNEGLKEKKLAGPLGRFGWLKNWFVQEIEDNRPAGQTLITACFETTDYYLLLKYDFRSSNFEWAEVGVVKLDSIDKVDIEQPYRFWLRRFFFSASH